MSAVAVDVLFGALAVIASAVNMSVALLLGYAGDLQAMGRRNPMAVGGVGGALFAAPLGLCVRTLVVWSPRTTDHAEDARTDHTQQSGPWKSYSCFCPVAGPLGAVVLGIDECSNMSLDAGYAAACGPLGMLLLWFVVAAQTVVSRAYKIEPGG
ncbi:hypothetical protein B0H21DRAFT_770853 [Amylocystis lapponica]|nr:hypothetical protein B0H21DRAFT_770853 [Amylocystis lapponica]